MKCIFITLEFSENERRYRTFVFNIVYIFNITDRKFTIKYEDKWHGKKIKWKKRFFFDTTKGYKRKYETTSQSMFFQSLFYRTFKIKSWFEEKAIKDLLKDGIAGECEFGLGRLY